MAKYFLDLANKGTIVGLGKLRKAAIRYLPTTPFAYSLYGTNLMEKNSNKKTSDHSHSGKIVLLITIPLLPFFICCYLAPAVAATAVPDEAGVARLRVGDWWLMTLLHRTKRHK